MRVIGEFSIGGSWVRLVELSHSPYARMEIQQAGECVYTLDLNTEMMTQMRHLLRMACRITRSEEERCRSTLRSSRTPSSP